MDTERTVRKLNSHLIMAGQVPVGYITFENFKPPVGIIFLIRRSVCRRLGVPGTCVRVLFSLRRKFRNFRFLRRSKHYRHSIHFQPVFPRSIRLRTGVSHEGIHKFSDNTMLFSKKLHIDTIGKPGKGDIVFGIRLVSLVHRPLFLICFQFKYIRIIVQRRDQPHRGIGDRKAQQYKQHQQPCFSQKA